MLNQAEMERIEQLEAVVASLREEVAMQQILISGLLYNLFRNDSSHQSAFFSVLREELNKLPIGSRKHQEFSHSLQQLIERYR